ncbi:hypothetical protein KUCAC02_007151, partial [Chaenocephalus aceratus]
TQTTPREWHAVWRAVAESRDMTGAERAIWVKPQLALLVPHRVQTCFKKTSGLQIPDHVFVSCSLSCETSHTEAPMIPEAATWHSSRTLYIRKANPTFTKPRVSPVSESLVLFSICSEKSRELVHMLGVNLKPPRVIVETVCLQGDFCNVTQTAASQIEELSEQRLEAEEGNEGWTEFISTAG